MGIKGLIVVVVPEAMVFQELNLSQSAIKTLYHDYGYNSKFFQVLPSCTLQVENGKYFVAKTDLCYAQ